MKKIFISLLIIFSFTVSGYSYFVNVTLSALGVNPAQVPGVASLHFVDFNNDGYQDIFIGPKIVYMNKGNGTFQLQTSSAIGLGFIPSGESRASLGDADNDGDIDIVIAHYYGKKCWYLKNISTDTNLMFVADTLFNAVSLNTNLGQPTFWDMDEDGKLEIFLGVVGNWPPTYAIYWSRLFKMNPGGVYEDVTNTYIPQMTWSIYRKAIRGTVACDYDNDGDMDMFNPVYGISTSENFANVLWRNLGNGLFWDFADSAGVAIDNYSQYGGLASGASWGDFNNDGLFDLAVCNIHGVANLYKNNGNGTFTNVTASSGLYTSQGEYHNSLWLDYDNDGYLDLFFNKWYNNQIALLYHNEGATNPGQFTLKTWALGFNPGSDLNYLQGWAAGDYDRDGDLDLMYDNISTNYAGRYLWRNELDSISANNKWIIIKLVGDSITCNRTAPGAQVRLRFHDNTWSGVKQVECSSADESMNMHPIHFGLGLHTSIKYIQVKWLCGRVEYWFPSQVNQWITLVEGTGSTTEVNEEISAVDNYELGQNYPNPFNPVTTIPYKISKPGNVDLRVFNILGEEIAVLINNYQPQGNYSIPFNGENIPSGVYFYRLRINNISLVKRMILLK